MNIELYNADCVDVLKTIEDNSVDLTVTSPPYDDLRDYGGNSRFSFESFKEIAKNLYRVTKRGGCVVWIVNDSCINGSESGSSFKQALFFKEIGFNLHDTMIWNKKKCAFPNVLRYHSSFEYMFVISKGKPEKVHLIEDKQNVSAGSKIHTTERQKDGTCKKSSAYKNGNAKIKDVGRRFNVWEIPPEPANKTGHPAVFPLRLVKDHIISWSDEGDTVLDCFMGSGTTGVACVETNRNFIGIEIFKDYYEISKKRIEEAKKYGGMQETFKL